MQEKKKIIVAPLNWGLGHAARCIPIINALLENGYEVIIASDGGALTLLQKEFPALESLELPAYNIHYAGKNLALSVALQSFKILFAVVREYFFLKKFLKNTSQKNTSQKNTSQKNTSQKNTSQKNTSQKNTSQKNTSTYKFLTDEQKYTDKEESSSLVYHHSPSNIYAIISDNRLGFFNCVAEKNIFITHQYNIKTPYRSLDFFINIFNRFFINRFDACWIPDVEGIPNLAGSLSHGAIIKKNTTRYIGALTRMKNFDAPKIYTVTAVLSGPEPQRTELEKIILNAFQKYTLVHPEKKLCIVRGTGSDVGFPISNVGKSIEVKHLLTTGELNEVLMQSELLIARSGYSTIMDLTVLKMPAILIPTPGQTEQEYLADKLLKENIFYAVAQDALDLKKDLPLSKNYAGFKTNEFVHKSTIEFL